jgi:hypothetical protein
MKRERSHPHASSRFTTLRPFLTLAGMLGAIALVPTALASAGGFAIGRSHGSGGSAGATPRAP